MSKNKSLGSSPIGFKSKSNAMGFIPDLGVSKSNSTLKTSQTSTSTAVKKSNNKESNSSKEENKTEKKIVSYNLELELIEEVKTTASKKEMYYSTLVSTALKTWLAENA